MPVEKVASFGFRFFGFPSDFGPRISDLHRAGVALLALCWRFVGALVRLCWRFVVALYSQVTGPAQKKSAKLAADLLGRGLFPTNARADANHLATTTCGAVDYLLTWNYRHLANAVVLHGLEKFLRERGVLLPRVCTPEELMGI